MTYIVKPILPVEGVHSSGKESGWYVPPDTTHFSEKACPLGTCNLTNAPPHTLHDYVGGDYI